MQDQVAHLQPAALDAFDDVLCRRHCAGDDMHFHFQLHAAHADRLAHVFLAIDDEFLRQDMQNLLVGWQRDGACGFNHTIDIGLRYLGILDFHHAMRIQALDVAAGNAGKHAG